MNQVVLNIAIQLHSDKPTTLSSTTHLWEPQHEIYRDEFIIMKSLIMLCFINTSDANTYYVTKTHYYFYG